MEVKKGYKASEIGIIPKEWEVISLGEMFTFSGGVSASRAQLSDNGYCYLHYGDIHTSNKSFIDVENEYSVIPKLNIPLNIVSSKSLLDDGDIVFVDASEDDEGASRHQVIKNPKGIPFVSGLHTIVAKPKDTSLENGFKKYCFQTRSVKNQFRFYAVGTKVTGISKTNISKIQIPIPNKIEQAAIAVLLSDVDELINKLEELIVKKRNIKQGVMQELLAGKRRLQGFSGKWEKRRLGDIAEIRDGTHQTPIYVDSGIPFYSVENVTNNNFDKTKYISLKEHQSLTKMYKIEKGDILMTRIGSIGECKYISWEVNASFYVSLALLKIKREYSAEYVSYYSNLEDFKKEIKLNSLQFAIPQKINLGQISDIKIKMPISITEQRAISEVVCNMDSEIEALEMKLEKLKLIKLGMMQNLLNGRIRLA